MAASDPQGGQAFWKSGVPYSGLEKADFLEGQQTYWRFGLPAEMLFPAAGPSEPEATQPLRSRNAFHPRMGARARR